MKKPSPFWVSISIVFVVLGLLVAVQFRSNNSKTNLPLRSAQEITTELNNIRLERDRIAEEIINLQTKAGSSDVAQNVNQAAGILAVSGSGIVLNLENTSQDSSLYLVTDEDLLKLINECWAAGAEAVSINDNRMIATSGFKSADNVIMVNQTKISPPYVIKAIGDPEVLETSLAIKGGWLETMKIWGITVDLQKNEIVNIPGYNSSIQFRYGKAGK